MTARRRGRRRPSIAKYARPIRARAEAVAAAPIALPRRAALGLAGRLLLLTIGFVLLAMGLFYATRLSAYRENWLRDRLMVAHTAMLVFGETGDETLPEELATKILHSVGAKTIAVTLPDGRRLVATSGIEPAVGETFELGDPSMMDGNQAAFRTLFAAPGSIVRVVGRAQSDGALVDITLDQTPLIDAMWRISAQFPHPVADRVGGGDLRAVGGAVVDGDPAGAPAHLEHHRLRRAAAGGRAHHRAERTQRRNRPRGNGARGDAGLARR